MKRMITGLQPSGRITIGNYIGAIRQMINNQDLYESFIFVADMHAITIPQDPEALKKNIRELVALYIACGIDPNKNVIFLQSDNYYHANVSWILECNTPFGVLGRMTQFKDKSKKHQNFMAGLLTYPILMAADILIYDADIVPVGKDQKQHVELARDIAESFNKRYNTEFFKIPEPVISKETSKIGDLIDPTKKMSKSAENKKGVIFLLDSEADIRKKIMGATTDSEMNIKYDVENKPGISSLIAIYHELTGLSIAEIEEKYKGQNYGTFKKDVADVVVNTLIPIQERFNKLVNSKELDDILENGKNKTLEIAKAKYEQIKKIVGLDR
jgi:tryptophanyl-tRNA synthetase